MEGVFSRQKLTPKNSAEKKVLKHILSFVICIAAGSGGSSNRKFNSVRTCAFRTSQISMPS
jgi:hypothetical protein